MRVLYIKNNSERNKRFQLRTTIFKEKGKKFVTKEAITKEATAHIENMYSGYKLLQKNIINPKLKIVPTKRVNKKKLIFDFIKGESFEAKIKRASKEALKELINEYKELIKKSFKTTTFDHKKMVNSNFKQLFGDYDFSELDGLVCFDNFSNLDLIFSNLIYKDDTIYMIDYEWCYNLSVPIDFVLYRVASLQNKEVKDLLIDDNKYNTIFTKMERFFIDNYVMKNGFYHYRHNYIKENMNINIYIKETKEEIEDLKIKNHEVHKAYQNLIKIHEELKKEYKKLSEDYKKLNKEHNKLNKLYQDLIREHREVHEDLNSLNLQIRGLGEALEEARATVELRDLQLEALRLKNRLKKLAYKINPIKKEEIKDPFDPDFRLKYKTYAINRCKEYNLTPQIEEEINNFSKKPLISIIMPVYNVDPKWLDLAIFSVKNQWYPNWELCIVDDKSTNKETINYLKKIKHPQIKVKFSKINGNISKASNEAAKMAKGEYLALLDNDDEITPNALYEVVKVINKTDADFIYTDESFIDTNGICKSPHFKPNFSPDLLLTHNYITHFSCFKRELFDKVGGFDSRFDGAQDYDLFVKMSEHTSNIEHIPQVLYYWRTVEGSTSGDSKAKPEALTKGKTILEEHLKRKNIKGHVEFAKLDHFFRVRYDILNNPLVSIIIPFKDKPELLETCVKSLLKYTTYQNFEVIGVSNNSEEKETFELMKELEALDSRIKFYEYNVPFNYAKINNYAVDNLAKGEHVLLLNNDIELIHEGWLEAMLEHSQRKEIGCVGAKLYYPNNTIQHAGVIVGLGGVAGHSHKHSPRESHGYFSRLMAIQNLSAVTGACLMVEKSIYQEVGGMDDVNFKVAFNDVDFCLRVMYKGYRNLFTPYAEMYHHESISRGYEDTAEKIERFRGEKEAFRKRHKKILEEGDPYYNPNLCLDKEDFSICPK